MPASITTTFKKEKKMAKSIRSLSTAAREAQKVLLNNVKPEKLRKNGTPTEPLKGKPARVEAARRTARDITNLLRKCITLRVAKKLVGSDVKREIKVVYEESLFAGMTPRQVKHLKKRPNEIEVLRKVKAEALLAAKVAKEKRIDEARDYRARVKAAAKVRALRENCRTLNEG